MPKKIVIFSGNITFSDAFSVARNELFAEEFEWQGSRFHTKLHDETRRIPSKDYSYKIIEE